MPYDEYLVERVDRFFASQDVDLFSKPMMGALVFMVKEKMYVGMFKDKKTKDWC